MGKRRQVLRTLSLGLLASPLGVLAERGGKVWPVAVLAFPLRPERLDEDKDYGEIPHALRDLGYEEGKNLVIGWRFAGGRCELTSWPSPRR